MKKWLKKIFSSKEKVIKKLTFDDLYRRYLKEWFKSELVGYSDPHGFTSEFRRRVRIFYNHKWHKGRFKLWKNWDKKNADKYFIVKTKSGRKMMVPKEKVYFKQKHKEWEPVPHNDYFEIYTILMYIEGDISVYEKKYKEFKKELIK